MPEVILKDANPEEEPCFAIVYTQSLGKAIWKEIFSLLAIIATNEKLLLSWDNGCVSIVTESKNWREDRGKNWGDRGKIVKGKCP